MHKRDHELYEYIAHSIAEITEWLEPTEYNRGYIRALKDLGEKFFPNDPELWT